MPMITKLVRVVLNHKLALSFDHLTNVKSRDSFKNLYLLFHKTYDH